MPVPRHLAKKKRFTAAQARAALLDAGLQLLEERGLELGVARVSLNDAVLRSGVPRPSAYRVFSSGDLDPQDEFRTNLLLHLFTDSTHQRATERAFAAAADVLLVERLRVDRGDPDELAFVLREMVRSAAATIWSSATAVEGVHLSTVLSLVVDPEPYQPLVGAVDRHRRETVERNLGFYRATCKTFGIRPRRPFDLRQVALYFAFAVDQIWDGNLGLGDEPGILRPTGPHGELLPWTPFGISLEGLILVMFEEDPDAPASARLSAWLR